VHSTPPTNTPIDTKRRRFLSVAAGGAIAAGIPAAALADAPTPTRSLLPSTSAVHLAAIDELSRLEKIHGDWDGSITEKPCDDDCDTFDFLVGTAATTIGGLFAKFDYLREIASREARMLDEREGTALYLIESLAESIGSIWGVQV
jgi:hypothetical protein